MNSCTLPLEARLLTAPTDAGFDEAWTIYDASFPRSEKRDRARFVEALGDPLYRPWVFSEGECTVGIAFCWRMPRALYLEHLAVDPLRRNGRIGSRILEALGREGLPVILEIEPPEDELTCRRRDFYRRNGFTENPQEYIHPSYCRPFAPHRLVLMSRPEPLGAAQTAAFEKFVRERALFYSDHRPAGKDRRFCLCSESSSYPTDSES